MSGKRKLPQINFDDCQIDDEPLPKYLVQIGVDETEVRRRLTCFVDRKREEIDIKNVRDFIDSEQTANTEDECSCARVNSTVYRKGGRSHLKGKTVVVTQHSLLVVTRSDENTKSKNLCPFSSFYSIEFSASGDQRIWTANENRGIHRHFRQIDVHLAQQNQTGTSISRTVTHRGEIAQRRTVSQCESGGHA